MWLLRELSTQLRVLAQGHGLDQWGDILVIVVMAFLWLAGGLAKVLSTRKGARQEATARQQGSRRETWLDRLARKAQEIQRAAAANARQLEQTTTSGTPAKASRKRQVPPQPPAGKITIRHGRTGDSVMVYERPVSRSVRDQDRDSTPRQQTTQAAMLTEPQSIEPAFEPLTEIPPHAASPGQPAGLQPVDVIDFTDPDALKKAILHYEILGRPLALRERSEEATVF
ncbi:MAG: hypothetical protein ABFD90_04810 [Phycisphaerales bacterium]